MHYDLTVNFDLAKEKIQGENIITFYLKEKSPVLQLDLYSNMRIKSITMNGEIMTYTRKYDAILIDIAGLESDSEYRISVAYSGSPLRAINPPWKGGFQWTYDDEGNYWTNVSCQGIGASLWWPNKDHLSDEPDSMNINLIVPSDYQAVSNGNLLGIIDNGSKIQYSWKVSYPINNYNVTFSIGKYAHFSTNYKSKTEGVLSCDYYVMPYNLEKAKKHFKQVDGVLEAFEYYFGPYPFWNDGYALIETPHLGMEHQSGIAYGNRYQRGYMGGRIPSHMNWDYIIVHETAHEYWGNAVSINDNAELWIHESFTTYMEALYVEYHFGIKESIGYLLTQRNHENNYPMVGPKDVNFHDFKSSDHYFKGSWMIHSLRSSINNDDLFFEILKEFYDDHKYKNAVSEDFFKLVNEKTSVDYMPFFEQYLYHPYIPVLEYQLNQKGKNLKVSYRWKTKVNEFNMPFEFGTSSNMVRVSPKVKKWKTKILKNTKISEFQIADNLYLIDAVRIRK